MALVQSQYADSGSAAVASQGVSLGAAATAGNLLVIVANSDATLTTPTGFTLATSAVNSQALYIWYKVAAGGETSFTTTLAASTSCAMWAAEYSGATGAPLDQTASQTTTTFGTSFGTGTTAATSQASELVIVAVGPALGWSGSVGAPSGMSWASATMRANGFTTIAANQNCALAVGDITTVATGAQSDTLSWTNGANAAGGAVATFKLAAAAGIPFAPSRAVSAVLSRVPWLQRDRSNAVLVGATANPLGSPLWRTASETRTRAVEAPGSHVTFRPATAAQFAQRDRRNANTVGTAENPLTIQPLPPRTVPLRDPGEGYWLQKDRRDATSLGGTAPAVIPPPVQARPQGRDPGETWWLQRPAQTDPSVLATALLEVPPTGQAQTPATQGVMASREWWWPQQPARLADPTLITTALMEVPPTGPAQMAAGQWQVAYRPAAGLPQQTPRVADPLLIGTALLEVPASVVLPVAALARPGWLRTPARLPDPLLLAPAAGPDADPTLLAWLPSWQTVNTAALQVSRRSTPAQRQALADQSTPPPDADPTLLGLLAALLARLTPATHTDRREVPQQRPYISDPSTYPTVAPTDPLTVAWGAGGPLWHVVHTPETHGDRREVPAQPARVSPPDLLGTALLEGVLLGGADDLQRHRAGWPVTWRPQPARSPAALAQLQDPTVLGGSRARAELAALLRVPARGVQRVVVWFVGSAPPAPVFAVAVEVVAAGPSAGVMAATAAAAITAATGGPSAAAVATGGPSAVTVQGSGPTATTSGG